MFGFCSEAKIKAAIHLGSTANSRIVCELSNILNCDYPIWRSGLK